MKHVLKLLLVLLAFSTTSSLVALPTSTAAVAAEKANYEPFILKAGVSSVDDFMALTPKKYKEITGEKLSLKETVILKAAQTKMKALGSENLPMEGSTDKILIYVLCFFIPPLAVFLTYGIGEKFWINVVLTLLCGLPGVIHAFIVCAKHYNDI